MLEIIKNSTLIRVSGNTFMSVINNSIKKSKLMKALKKLNVKTLKGSEIKNTFGGNGDSITIIKTPPVVKPVYPNEDIFKAFSI